MSKKFTMNNLKQRSETAIRFLTKDPKIKIRWIQGATPSSDAHSTIILPLFDQTKLDENTLRNISGFVDHESAHILFTNSEIQKEHVGFKWITYEFEGNDYMIQNKKDLELYKSRIKKLKKAKAKIKCPGSFGIILNAIEDPRVEHCIGKKFIGCKMNIQKMNQIAAKDLVNKLYEKKTKGETASPKMIALMVLCTDMWKTYSGLDKKVKELIEMVSEEREEAETADSTYEAVYLASKIWFKWFQKRVIKKEEPKKEERKKSNLPPKISSNNGMENFEEEDKDKDKEKESQAVVEDGIKEFYTKLLELEAKGKVIIKNRLDLFEKVKKIVYKQCLYFSYRKDK